MKEGQLCYAVADSGANILVAPFEVAESYNLPVFRWDSPVEISFGKQGSKSVSRFYAWMGPVLGKAALLTDAVGVLLPILPVAKRGFKFLFDDKEVLIIETKSEKKSWQEESLIQLRVYM